MGIRKYLIEAVAKNLIDGNSLSYYIVERKQDVPND